MRLVCSLLFALAACGRASGATPIEPVHAAGAFQPTAFSVDIRGRGRPVILIPGLGCPSSVWDDTVAHLRDYETYQIALAGFAGKPRIDAPLVKTTVDELARYIRDRHLVSPIIVGHSLGGTVAYMLASREPTLIGPTIVVDAGAGDDSPDAAAAAQVRDAWAGASDEQFTQRVQAIFGQMSTRPDRLGPVLTEVAKSDRRAIGEAIYELSTTSVRGELDKIRAPVLLVLADGSRKDDFRRQADAIRDREVVVVPATRHFVMLDDPAGFFAAVDRFLAEHEPIDQAAPRT